MDEIILLENVADLGRPGEVVKISRRGYARFLTTPFKLKKADGSFEWSRRALKATPENLSIFERKKEELEKKDAQLKKKAQDFLTHIQTREKNDLGVDIELVIICQASETGKLYGSVRPSDVLKELSKKIADDLKTYDFHLSAKDIQISDSVRQLGLFKAKLQLYPGISASMMLNVARSEEEARQQAVREAVVSTEAEEKQEDAGTS